MANTQVFAEWQQADRVAEAAQRALSSLIRDGHEPTAEQLEEVVRLRRVARDLLDAMVADLKVKYPTRPE